MSKVLATVVPVSPALPEPLALPYAGRYYRGDGLGYNIVLDLENDGSYRGQWRGCLGVYGTAAGKWRVKSSGKARQIVLEPTRETNMMKGHLRILDIIYRDKKVLFLPTSERDLETVRKIRIGHKLYVWRHAPDSFYFQKERALPHDSTHD